MPPQAWAAGGGEEQVLTLLRTITDILALVAVAAVAVLMAMILADGLGSSLPNAAFRADLAALGFLALPWIERRGRMLRAEGLAPVFRGGGPALGHGLAALAYLLLFVGALAGQGAATPALAVAFGMALAVRLTALALVLAGRDAAGLLHDGEELRR